MKNMITALLVAFAASSAVPAFAASSHNIEQGKICHHKPCHKGEKKHGHCHEAKSAIAVTKLPASTQAYIKANEKMHSEMTLNYSGNADIDFVRGMIPHHKGAVAMAEIELKYGKSAENRALAKEIIAAQKKEIRQMETWLKSKEHEVKKQEKAAVKISKK